MEKNRQIEILEMMKSEIAIPKAKTGIYESLFVILTKEEILEEEYNFIKKLIFLNRPNKDIIVDIDLWLDKTTKNLDTKQIYINFITELINLINTK